MGKTAEAAADSDTTPAAVAREAAATISIKEFCRRTSAKAHRVEAVSAFHALETRLRHIHDSPDEFAKRFKQFLTGGKK